MKLHELDKYFIDTYYFCPKAAIFQYRIGTFKNPLSKNKQKNVTKKTIKGIRAPTLKVLKRQIKDKVFQLVILYITQREGINFQTIFKVIELLVEKKLLYI